MRKYVTTIAKLLHRASLGLCALLFCVMALSVMGNVVLRYALDSGLLWLQDLAIFSFGLLSILSIPCALAMDRHVRVDIFRQNQRDVIRGRTDQAGYWLFGGPLFLLLLYYALPDVLYSASIGEGSQQIGGLPFFYLVKAGLPLACVLTLVQGLALLIGSNDGNSDHGQDIA